MPEIDYLNDPLLVTPDEKPKISRSPLLQRASEALNRINLFVDETGAFPLSAKGRSVQERMLANELAGLRASRKELTGLKTEDRHALLFSNEKRSDPLDDPLL